MIYSTVNHQELPFSDPTHLFDDVILEWSLVELAIEKKNICSFTANIQITT